MNDIKEIMQDHELACEFALIYGRWPEPGEIAHVFAENAADAAEKGARAALRPGFLNMLKYWWFK